MSLLGDFKKGFARGQAKALAEEAEEQTRQLAKTDPPGTVRLNSIESRMVRAANYRDALAKGEPIAALDPGAMVLDKEESLYVSTPATVLEFAGQEVEYSQGGALFFGSPLFVVGSLAASVALSAANKARAEKRAMAQWRALDVGTLLITNRRLCIRGSAAWHEIAFSDIRMAECEIDAIAIHVVNRPPLRITVQSPEQVFITLQKIAWDRLPDAMLPGDLAERIDSAQELILAAPVEAPGAMSSESS